MTGFKCTFGKCRRLCVQICNGVVQFSVRDRSRHEILHSSLGICQVLGARFKAHRTFPMFQVHSASTPTRPVCQAKQPMLLNTPPTSPQPQSPASPQTPPSPTGQQAGHHECRMFVIWGVWAHVQRAQCSLPFLRNPFGGTGLKCTVRFPAPKVHSALEHVLCTLTLKVHSTFFMPPSARSVCVHSTCSRRPSVRSVYSAQHSPLGLQCTAQ